MKRIYKVKEIYKDNMHILCCLVSNRERYSFCEENITENRHIYVV